MAIKKGIPLYVIRGYRSAAVAQTPQVYFKGEQKHALHAYGPYRLKCIAP